MTAACRRSTNRNGNHVAFRKHRQTCVDLYGKSARHLPHIDENHDLANPGTTSQDSYAENQDNVPEDKLFTYVIVRDDLQMAPGKLAAQAVHAARLSLLRYIKRYPHRLDELISLNSCGSVVILHGKNLRQLEEAHTQATAAHLPTALFSDSGHIPVVWFPKLSTTPSADLGLGSDAGPRVGSHIHHNENFDGSPIVTSLAIGPASRETMRHITKRMRCV